MASLTRDQARRALVDHVRRKLRLNTPSAADSHALDPYLKLLPSGKANKLTRILTALDGRGQGVLQPELVFGRPTEFIQGQAEGGPSPASFLDQWQGLDPAEHFEAWTHLIYRAGLAVQAQSGEPGVSLYHEFKLLSAVVHAALANPNGPEDGFMLISGDFPGVQRAIYTVSSDGATKGVRGRSFFLQLLADCVVRRLLAELGDLPITNAIYVAGGNFLLLGPVLANAVPVEDWVREISTDINARLLELFHGDISLVTATLSLPSGAFQGDMRTLYGELKAREGRNKTRPLADVAERDWGRVFGTEGIGGKEACIVCQREPMNRHEQRRAEEQRNRGETWTCPECEIFRDLADHLAKLDTPYLVFETNPQSVVPNSYAGKLHRVTGWACSVYGSPPDPGTLAPGSVVLQLNPASFDAGLIPRHIQGFRLFALHTPLVQDGDVPWLKHRYGDTLPPDQPRWPHPGEDIRDFEILAARSNAGLERLGILRMDVDSLGKVFSERLKPMTLTRLAATSDALSLFFDGYLSDLCADFERTQDRPGSLYLLYGGGDDLFIVGEWDVMPHFAKRLRDEFSTYSNGQLSISAGIALVPQHFPFYRAAEIAKEALDDEAKAHKRPDGVEKDAISFLGAVLPWRQGEAWSVVAEQYARLLDIAKTLGSNTVTQNVLRIYHRWESDRLIRGSRFLMYGPYVWLAAYRMARLAKDYPKVRDAIRAVQSAVLTPANIPLSGPAARWAELERRAKM